MAEIAGWSPQRFGIKSSADRVGGRLMRVLLVAGVACLAVAPCRAQEMSTVQYILAKGVVIHAELLGRPVDMSVTYIPDGTSATKIVGPGGRGVDVPGKWRVDGDK